MVVVPIQWDLREGGLFVLLFDLCNVMSCVGFFFGHSLICVYLQFLNLKRMHICWHLMGTSVLGLMAMSVNDFFTFAQYFYSSISLYFLFFLFSFLFLVLVFD